MRNSELALLLCDPLANFFHGTYSVHIVTSNCRIML